MEYTTAVNTQPAPRLRPVDQKPNNYKKSSGPGDLIAAGVDDDGFARAYRHDGGGWKPLDTPSEPATFFSAVWGGAALQWV
ncbi:MAG: hypothetical protein R6V85_15875 [Polyangia bacterium]